MARVDFDRRMIDRLFPNKLIESARKKGAKFHHNKAMNMWVCLDEKTNALWCAWFLTEQDAAYGWLRSHGYEAERPR